MAMSLTTQQANLLAFIERYQADHNGVSPSYAEMGEALGGLVKSGIHRLIQGLKERGKIEQWYGRVRAITIVPDNPLDGVSTPALWAELQRRGEVRQAA